MDLFPVCLSVPPKFIGELKNVTVTQGRDATFTCSVTHLGGYKVSPILFFLPIPSASYSSITLGSHVVVVELLLAELSNLGTIPALSKCLAWVLSGREQLRTCQIVWWQRTRIEIKVTSAELWYNSGTKFLFLWLKTFLVHFGVEKNRKMIHLTENY